MNFKAVPKADKTNTRSAPSIMGGIIAQVGVNDILEGDYLVKDSQNRDWLEVLIINGLQINQPTYVATWVCNIEHTPPLPPIDPLPFQVGLNITADSPMELSRVETDGTLTLITTQPAGNYVLKFVANDSEKPFMHME